NGCEHLKRYRQESPASLENKTRHPIERNAARDAAHHSRTIDFLSRLQGTGIRCDKCRYRLRDRCRSRHDFLAETSRIFNTRTTGHNFFLEMSRRIDGNADDASPSARWRGSTW